MQFTPKFWAYALSKSLVDAGLVDRAELARVEELAADILSQAAKGGRQA